VDEHHDAIRVAELPSVEPAKGDRRFTSDAWKKSPYHNFVKQAHPVNIRHFNNLIECVSVDDKTHGLSRFFSRQILDALSPSNYLATNLEAMQGAMETGGDSLAAGVNMRTCWKTWGKGGCRWQTRRRGRNLAVTPGAVVFENELIQLIQYL
jgi:polyhydroxyalkanoate synthase subunit PhaC